jgi:hypothetical protein
MSEMTKTTETSERGTEAPVTFRQVVIFWTLVLGAGVYAVIGMVYAAGHSLDRAGITGLGAFFAWGSQVLGWPLMLFMK